MQEEDEVNKAENEKKEQWAWMVLKAGRTRLPLRGQFVTAKVVQQQQGDMQSASRRQGVAPASIPTGCTLQKGKQQ